MEFIGFASWPDVLAHIQAGGTVYYHAPMDHQPIHVRVELRRGAKVRVFPHHLTVDPFTADVAHFDRFRKVK